MTRGPVGVGIIGGGLMGKEVASALARWIALENHPVEPSLVAVCDLDAGRRDWFRRVPSVQHFTGDHRELLHDDRVDVVYIAVPHDLHEEIYLDAVAAGKDFLGEKPFGIDLRAAQRIVSGIEARDGLFVRCSSEMPFYPGAQAVIELVRSGAFGRIIEAESAFLHSSDLDLGKPINWKRQSAHCGSLGVLNDLGMHTLHVPLRLGWTITRVNAVLQDIVPTRPGPDGSPAPCDTWENGTLLCEAHASDGAMFPLTVMTKRISPGDMNTWRLRVVGLNGGAEFTTAEPRTLRRFAVHDGRQVWETMHVGSQSVVPTVTGGIFEFGFADAIQQMWAAFLAEREDAASIRFGCATPREALAAHRIFAAADRAGRDHVGRAPEGGPVSGLDVPAGVRPDTAAPPV